LMSPDGMAAAMPRYNAVTVAPVFVVTPDNSSFQPPTELWPATAVCIAVVISP
jgi:hypothetical protein